MNKFILKNNKVISVETGRTLVELKEGKIKERSEFKIEDRECNYTQESLKKEIVDAKEFLRNKLSSN